METDNGANPPRPKALLNGERGDAPADVGDAIDAPDDIDAVGEAEGDWRLRAKKAALGILVGPGSRDGGGWERGWGKESWVPAPFMTAMGMGAALARVGAGSGARVCAISGRGCRSRRGRIGGGCVVVEGVWSWSSRDQVESIVCVCVCKRWDRWRSEGRRDKVGWDIDILIV